MGDDEKRSGADRRAAKERRSGIDTRSGERNISSATADPEPIGDRTRIEEPGLATSRRLLIKSNDNHVVTRTGTTTPAATGSAAVANQSERATASTRAEQAIALISPSHRVRYAHLSFRGASPRSPQTK